MPEKTKVEQSTRTEWNRRWAAYQEHLKRYPGDKDNWRVFYAGCEAVEHAPTPAPEPTADEQFITAEQLDWLAKQDGHNSRTLAKFLCNRFRTFSRVSAPAAAQGALDEEIVRKEFESFMDDAFGGDASRFTVRDPIVPDTYKAQDVAAAWSAFRYAVAWCYGTLDSPALPSSPVSRNSVSTPGGAEGSKE